MLRAAVADPEAGDDLVEDEQGLLPRGDPAQALKVALGREDDAHVGRDRLDDDRGDAALVLPERGLHGRQVVERQHDGRRREGLRHAGGVGDAERGGARARRDEEAVDVAVVAARELDDQVALGEGARGAHRAHVGLGAGAGHAQQLDRREGLLDGLGQLHLGHGRGAEGAAALEGALGRRDDLPAGVAEHQGAPGQAVIHEAPAVAGDEPGAGARPDEHGRAAHGLEGPHRRVDAAHERPAGAREERLLVQLADLLPRRLLHASHRAASKA